MAFVSATQILRFVEPLIYRHRIAGLVIISAFTLFMGVQASRIEVDAGFEKQIPLEHPYMKVLKQYEDQFGGANLISIALIQEDGDIYNERFLSKLKAVTDEIFFLPGVDRSRVRSLFTPGVRYIEIVEGGFKGDDVVPRNYEPSPEMFEKIRRNVGKANIIGRLVSGDQRGAMIVAELLEHHPVTGEKLDYRDVAKKLEGIRQKYETDDIKVHIIGFAKVVGNVTDASMEVVMFFGIALILTLILLKLYSGSLRLSLLPLGSSLIAVIWEFGLLKTFGFGLDPFAILVPFLVLANGVEHGIQMVNAWGDEVAHKGKDSYRASIASFRRVAIPGTAALITDVIGFATIALIDIDIIQEMAINAAFGMAAIIITNKWLMPILLTYVTITDTEKFKRRQEVRDEFGDGLWRAISGITERRNAVITLVVCVGLFGWALWMGQFLKIGDFKQGVPELRPDSRYNQDSAAIVDNFAIGVDLMKVIAETDPQGCIRHDVMSTIDRFSWHIQNTTGVDSVVSLPVVAKQLRSGWNEGSPKWQVLPRNPYAMVQSINPIPSSAGLQSADCSRMPILIFTEDHKAETLERIVATAKQFEPDHSEAPIHFALASGNVGVMAATNEVIAAEEKPILLWVYVAVTLMCWLSFRSIPGVLCIVLPLSLVSFMAYAFMATMEIGLKVATLPVTALAVGIGIDFGIYTYSVLEEKFNSGLELREAYYETLRITGKAVIFTGIALSIGVVTWIWSDLQFQIDMGILLVFMFLANMFAAILVLPALAHFLLKTRRDIPLILTLDADDIY